ncbi:uncharacterized protein LOC118433627 [Folsomia candida]|uniref:uncharacterized protein LOC118433627 n=1 Tax=Folsomia candida TaxID=158441 RepID=UPI001604E5C6|nr:uncharacterized protein LOC118433627 [Folsomia candida]
MLLKIFFFALCVSFSLGYVQELMFFTEPNAVGTELIFRTKEPHLTQYQYFLTNVKSWCFNGHWIGYTGTNYTIDHTLVAYSSHGNLLCYNTTLSTTMSVRYCGPTDTSTPSVTIFSEDYNSIPGGVERTFTSQAERIILALFQNI